MRGRWIAVALAGVISPACGDGSVPLTCDYLSDPGNCRREIPTYVGDVVERDGFVFADVALAAPPTRRTKRPADPPSAGAR